MGGGKGEGNDKSRRDEERMKVESMCRRNGKDDRNKKEKDELRRQIRNLHARGGISIHCSKQSISFVK